MVKRDVALYLVISSGQITHRRIRQGHSRGFVSTASETVAKRDIDCHSRTIPDVVGHLECGCRAADGDVALGGTILTGFI